MIRRALVACALLLVAAPAFAQDANVVSAVGESPVSAGEREARQRALDRAFVTAVDKAVRSMAPAPALEARSDAIRDRVLRRARLFVTRYQVRDEGVYGDQYRVAVSAWIDTGRLRQTVGDLGVALDAPPPPAPGVRARPKLVLLSVTRAGDQLMATFGSAASDGGDVAGSVARELREHGFELVSAAGVETPVGQAGGSWPLADADAVDIARHVGAGGAVMVVAEVADGGRIRGTRLSGAVARGAIRILDATNGGVVAGHDATAAAYGSSLSEAAGQAARQLGQRTGAAIVGDVSSYWPSAVVASDSVVIEIRGARSWQAVHEVLHALDGAPGIDRVVPRQFRPGFIAIEVVSRLAASRVARSLAGARFANSVVRVDTVGARLVRVEVTPKAVVE